MIESSNSRFTKYSDIPSPSSSVFDDLIGGPTLSKLSNGSFRFGLFAGFPTASKLRMALPITFFTLHNIVNFKWRRYLRFVINNGFWRRVNESPLGGTLRWRPCKIWLNFLVDFVRFSNQLCEDKVRLSN